MSWKVHETDEVFAALRGLCSNSYRMYDPCEHRCYYDHDCDVYECVVEDAAEEYERLLRHCDHQREQLARHEMEDGMDNIDGGTEVERIEGSSKVRAGSSITDELREYAEKNECKSYCKLLTAIADRIDAEHAVKVERLEKYRAAVDAMLKEYVKLPVDADGVPIKVGDTMEWPTTGESFEVVGISANTLFYIEHDFDDSAQWTAAHNKRHHHAPTVEDVLREFAGKVCNSGHQWGLDAADTIAEYAAKLRLAGEVE